MSGDIEASKREDDALRGRVAGMLEVLNEPGGPLNTHSDLATYALYGDTPARMRLWSHFREEYLARQSDVRSDGLAVLVTAGPPGAGKTTAVQDAIPDYERWRVIDADVVKEMLIRQALNDDVYAGLLTRALPDGDPIKPLELSSLVHRESVELVGYIRRHCMRRGENVVLEGTLGWHRMKDVHLREILEFGYGRLSILSVQAPREVAEERALQRWWSDRRDPTRPLGGRFIPRAVVVASYMSDGTNRCHENALALHNSARARSGLEVELLTVGVERSSVHGDVPESRSQAPVRTARSVDPEE